MKLPPILLETSPAGIRPQGSTIHACTANLGATPSVPGHPSLKHCFALIEDEVTGERDSLAFGLLGVGRESFPDLDSVHCLPAARSLGAAEVEEFTRAFRACGETPYHWHDNNCCNCLSNGLEETVGTAPPPHLLAAEQGIAASPFPPGV